MTPREVHDTHTHMANNHPNIFLFYIFMKIFIIFLIQYIYSRILLGILFPCRQPPHPNFFWVMMDFPCPFFGFYGLQNMNPQPFRPKMSRLP